LLAAGVVRSFTTQATHARVAWREWLVFSPLIVSATLGIAVPLLVCLDISFACATFEDAHSTRTQLE